ncbi:hypothetical protein GCM10023170_050420 [Phytohabitans houttuyneae]|uniref:Uncharacterized protein n=1 Tax=Phytohabitans houttuyneae TaxID=1076126 RepID=A0A6V8KR81_9ACTN|nr:hypothetical protein Phou_093080 [Phytohabitans houttuyneae]
MASKPLLQARVTTSTEHAEASLDTLTHLARRLLGDDVTCRTQTRHADRAGYVRVYLTVTREEERLCHESQGSARTADT